MSYCEDLAYLAGFIDGEGCIGIHHRGKAKGRKPTVRVSITNTNKDILIWCQNFIGLGGTLKVHDKNRNSNWKTAYRLEYDCKKAEALLKMIVPYLRVKKEQALLAIEYRKYTIPNGRYRPEENEIRGDLFARVLELNTRGTQGGEVK